MQRNERPSKSFTHVMHLWRTQPILELARKSVGFPFKSTRDEIDRDTNDGFHRRQEHLLTRVEQNVTPHTRQLT